MVGMNDLDEFDFVELVSADDASIIASGTSCLTTEAGSMSRHFDGKIGFGEESVAVEVRDGNFGSRDEKHLVVFDPVHVVLKLGKLSGAHHALTPYDVRDVDFFVAVFTSLKIEKVLDQGALKAGSLVAVYRKTRARNAGTVIEADHAVFFGNLEVVFSFKEGLFFSPGADDGIGFLVGSDRAIFVREIGDVEQELFLTRGGLRALVVELFNLVADLFDFGFDGR